jgi:hypothetical protein
LQVSVCHVRNPLSSNSDSKSARATYQTGLATRAAKDADSVRSAAANF